MSITERVKAKPHIFMPGETVTAAIKKYNFYDVSADEQKLLITQFKQINPDEIPRPGMRFMIPILPRHHEEAFKKSVKKL